MNYLTFRVKIILGVENNFPMRYFDRNVNDVSSTFESNLGEKITYKNVFFSNLLGAPYLTCHLISRFFSHSITDNKYAFVTDIGIYANLNQWKK